MTETNDSALSFLNLLESDIFDQGETSQHDRQDRIQKAFQRSKEVYSQEVRILKPQVRFHCDFLATCCMTPIIDIVVFSLQWFYDPLDNAPPDFENLTAVVQNKHETDRIEYMASDLCLREEYKQCLTLLLPHVASSKQLLDTAILCAMQHPQPTGITPEIITQFEEAIVKLNPTDGVLISMGQLLLQRDDRPGAIRMFVQAWCTRRSLFRPIINGLAGSFQGHSLRDFLCRIKTGDDIPPWPVWHTELTSASVPADQIDFVETWHGSYDQNSDQSEDRND